jgi:hypothetical protein
MKIGECNFMKGHMDCTEKSKEIRAAVQKSRDWLLNVWVYGCLYKVAGVILYGSGSGWYRLNVC